ncbi:MAG TPA: hypothetical protein VN513_06800, partial [Gemmatimonadales bacterium]|nr:hypothetical protein [Gemmatimonadales bacterium]
MENASLTQARDAGNACCRHRVELRGDRHVARTDARALSPVPVPGSFTAVPPFPPFSCFPLITPDAIRPCAARTRRPFKEGSNGNA